MRWFLSKLPATALVFLSACGLARCEPEPISESRVLELYKEPLEPVQGALSVYFLGHSLVGRDMPAMLAQLSEDLSYESQMGWGAELQAHWEPDVELTGGDVENDHPRFREAHEAIGSGYDVLVMTEKVSIQDAIKYHDSWHYMSLWSEKAAKANPDVRLYLYETWHGLNTEDGWLERIDGDLPTYWEGEIVDRALATERVDRPIYVIPGGQVMARFVREIEASGGVDGITSRQDLFRDNIHFNSIGAYLIALTHYAVIYGTSPVGLPHELLDAKGKPAPAPGPEAARLMQDVVWEVVTNYARTGVRP